VSIITGGSADHGTPVNPLLLAGRDSIHSPTTTPLNLGRKEQLGASFHRYFATVHHTMVRQNLQEFADPSQPRDTW
jgi:hypothetical protein